MKTLAEILRHRADHTPKRLPYTFLADGETAEQSFTFQELDRRARAIASVLQAEYPRGSRAILLYEAGLEFIAAFFACLYAGLLAVPVYPPQPQRLNITLPRLHAILRDAEPVVILTSRDVLTLLQALPFREKVFNQIPWLSSDDIQDSLVSSWSETSPRAEDIAFLQYTSGSTAQPKGIMVSHANIMRNLEMIRHAFQSTADSNYVSWLPHYHDMGLIGNLLQTLYLGSCCYFMSPTAFLRKPWRWLEAISKYQASISGAPNFAYALCTRKVSEAQKEMLDLSSWVVAYNGAETVRPDTMEEFYRAFSRCGLNRTALLPVYGLAEATLYVSGRSLGQGYKVLETDRTALDQNYAPSANQREPGRLVSCGQSPLEQQLRIVDPNSCRNCIDGHVGEIWISGDHIAQGYWKQPDQTEAIFAAFIADSNEGPFLRTGDLGFLCDRELYITGRIKDLIKLRGRSLYPQDIELSIENLRPTFPEIRLGCIAAFSLEAEEQEQVGVMLEVAPQKNPGFSEKQLRSEIRGVLLDVHDLAVQSITLLQPGSMPKTSSGKIMRHACRQSLLCDFQDGVVEPINTDGSGTSLVKHACSAEISELV